MTGSEKTLLWLNKFVKTNGHYPLLSEIKAQLEMAVDYDRNELKELSKQNMINVLENRIKKLDVLGAHKYEIKQLKQAIKTIQELIPPF